MSEEPKIGYVPYYMNKYPKDLNFKSLMKYNLVSSMEELRELLNVEGKVVAVDTEAKGLEFALDGFETDNCVVGFSFSFSPYDGYYVPLRHVQEEYNLDPIEALTILFEMMYKNKILLYNALFDLFLLWAEKGVEFDPDKVKIIDVMQLVYLADTNIKTNSLKETTKNLLGRPVTTFEDVAGKHGGFDKTDPQDSYTYACDDTAHTYALFKTLYPDIKKECEFILRLDTKLTKAMLFYQRQYLYLDSDFMSSMEEEAQEVLDQKTRELYKIVGYFFKVGSGKECSVAFKSIGVNTGAVGKAGHMLMGVERLAKIDHPAAKLLLEIRSLRTQINSYIKKLAKERTGRIQYSLCRIPTGRIASGNKNNGYFLNMSIQNLTKPDSMMYKPVPSDSPNAILGYEFIPLEGKEHGAVEGMSPKMNIRRAVTIPDDSYYYFHVDFDTEELRIAAALSGEPIWVEGFKTGADLHKLVAIKIWGEAAYDAIKRRNAKSCLGENSFVVTDNGMRRPCELINHESKLKNRYGRYVDYEMITEENQKTYLLTFDSGIQEEYKYDHSLLIWNGKAVEWKEVQDITEKDQIIHTTNIVNWESSDCNVDLRQYTKKKTKYSISFQCKGDFWPYLLGTYLGCGGAPKKRFNGIYVNSGIEFFVEEAKLDWILHNLHYYGFHTWHKKIVNVYKVVVNSSALGKWIELNFGSLKQKRVPDWVLSQWGVDDLKNFLTGMIDSGGTKRGKTVSFSHTNELVARSFSLIANMLGARTTMRKKNPKWSGYHKKYSSHQPIRYVVVLRESSFELPFLYERKTFKRNIKSHLGWELNQEYIQFLTKKYPQKKRALSPLTKGIRLTRHRLELVSEDMGIESNWYPTKVVKKEEGKGTVYCIKVVGDEPEYLSSCVISHNCNFGLLFGGSPYTLQNALGIPEDEAKELFYSFWSTLKTLSYWRDKSVSNAYSNDGIVKTFFGRPRRLKHYLSSSIPSIRNFGERSVISHKVQGTGADIIRICLVNLKDKVFNNASNREEVKFISTVHDEINFAIRKDVFYKWAHVIRDIMTIQPKGWPIPLITSCEVGYSMGNTFKFKWVGDILVPDTEE